jgi:hypothetical protein
MRKIIDFIMSFTGVYTKKALLIAGKLEMIVNCDVASGYRNGFYGMIRK